MLRSKSQRMIFPRFDQGVGAALANQALEFRRMVREVRAAFSATKVQQSIHGKAYDYAALTLVWERACDGILSRLDEYEKEARGAMRRPGDPKGE